MARPLAAWAAIAAAVLLAAAAPVSAKPRPVKRSIGSAGKVVPPSFAGFSIEYWSATDYFGAPGAPNAAQAAKWRAAKKAAAASNAARAAKANSAATTAYYPSAK